MEFIQNIDGTQDSRIMTGGILNLPDRHLFQFNTDTDVSLAAATETVITLAPTTVIDPTAFEILNDNTIKVKLSGHYYAGFTFKLYSATRNAEYTIKLYKNGTAVHQRDIADIDAHVLDWHIANILDLTAGDELQLKITSDNAATLKADSVGYVFQLYED